MIANYAVLEMIILMSERELSFLIGLLYPLSVRGVSMPKHLEVTWAYGLSGVIVFVVVLLQ